jgi:hypothetical protein
MDVIEYSLGSQRKAEVYVNRLLAYVLDPDAPHGMGPEFLRAVLDGLPAECAFDEDVHDLSDVVVDDQVRVDQVESDQEEGETVTSSGIVDLVIEVPNEWFLMIELKFSAADTQTEFYYRDATHVGGTPKEAYESGQYYLYLHQHDQPTATEPCFDNWTWKAFSTDVLEPFVLDNAARYPQRTVTQLRELRDDLKSISGMTEQEENTQEKIELYLDHYDAIRDVSDTFDRRWETFTDEWGIRLAETLEPEGVASYSNPDENVIAVDLGGDSGGGQRWWFRTASSDWGMIFKDGWWRPTDALTEQIHARDDDFNDVRIGFHHRLDRNRERAVGDRTLAVYFRNMGANDQTFIDTFCDRFDERRFKIAEKLPPSAETTGNKQNMVTATYDIDADSHETFFDAYVTALSDAFTDLVVDNEDLVSLLDECYRESVEDVYDVSISD